MRLNELLLEVRDRLQDLGGDVDAPDTYWQTNDAAGNFFWKNRELIRALNQTLTEFGRREPFHDRTGTLFKMPLVANKATYYYDPQVLIIDGLTLQTEGTPLEKVLPETLDYKTQHGTTWRSEDAGNPCEYVLDPKANTVRLYPAPSATAAANETLLVYCQYTPKADYTTTDITGNPDLCDVTDDMRDALCWGMQHYLYQKRGDDTFRPELAAYAERKFTELVGPPVSAQVLYNRQMNADTRTRIIGHPYTPKIKHNRTFRENTTASFR